MLFLAVSLIVAVTCLVTAPYWLARAWTRDRFWELRDEVYDVWRDEGYDSVVLSKFVHRLETAIDLLPRLTFSTLWSAHSVLRKVGQEEMRALFPADYELRHLTEWERATYEGWEQRYNRLLTAHLVFSSWSGLAVAAVYKSVTRLSRHQAQRAQRAGTRVQNDSRRLVAAGGSAGVSACSSF